MNKINIDFIRRRFEQIVAPAMGWRAEPFYTAGVPNHGRLRLEWSLSRHEYAEGGLGA